MKIKSSHMQQLCDDVQQNWSKSGATLEEDQGQIWELETLWERSRNAAYI